MAWTPGKFVWYEHVSNDVLAASRFYQPLFGWQTLAMDMGPAGSYHMIHNGGEGIGGYRVALPGVPNHWVSYLSVPDVDASCTAAAQSGANVLMPPTDFSPVGRGATIADPQGASFSLWKSAQGDRPDGPAALGDWCWNELMTTDTAAALRFYEEVFAYSHERVANGPSGSYFLLKTGATMRAGMMQCPVAGMAPAWLPYVRVGDCDATAARAVELGASLRVPPADIANVGRFCVITDPLGVAIAVLRPDL